MIAPAMMIPVASDGQSPQAKDEESVPMVVSPLASGLEDPHRPLVLSVWQRPANAQPRASRALNQRGGSRGAACVKKGRVVVETAGTARVPDRSKPV